MCGTSYLTLMEIGMARDPWHQLFVVCGQACMMILGFGKVRHSMSLPKKQKKKASYYANSHAVTRRMGFLLRELGSAFEGHVALR